MKRIQFKTVINATRERVWEVLWGAETYTQWTAPFSPGSRAVTDWQQGSKVLFVNEEGAGMVAEVAKRDEPSFMSFRHLGMVDKDGNEDFESEEVKIWAGALENYTLNESEDGTELIIDMDTGEDFEGMYREMWPKALAELKRISESK